MDIKDTFVGFKLWAIFFISVSFKDLLFCYFMNYVCLCGCVQVCLCGCVHVCLCGCVQVCLCLCVCVHMCLWVCAHGCRIPRRPEGSEFPGVDLLVVGAIRCGCGN